MKRLLPLLVLLAGCAGPPLQQRPGAAGPEVAESWYRQAAAAGNKVYAIDAAQSLIAITVRRAGPLSRLGHDHVVASRTLAGFAAPEQGRADFYFRLDQLTVDEPQLRREAGLNSTPSAAAIEGTRNNMLGTVLEAPRFPLVVMHARRVEGMDKSLRLTITLHGVTRTLDVPARLETNKEYIAASGTLQLRQTDFGITPLSVMAGALSVQDQLDLRFRIVARPVP